jgi:A/G-specific adenine glycosylase
MAEILVCKHDSNVPRSKTAMVNLPGVGVYIANAVLCFAYGESAPIVDTNVSRIMMRVYGIDKNVSGQAERSFDVLDACDRILPPIHAREFNWALLDLGALVCRSIKPRCNVCPVSEHCSYANESGSAIDR